MPTKSKKIVRKPNKKIEARKKLISEPSRKVARKRLQRPHKKTEIGMENPKLAPHRPSVEVIEVLETQIYEEPMLSELEEEEN